MRYRDAFKEKAVGCLLVGGLAISIVSAIALYMLSLGGFLRGTYTREPVTNRITDAGTLNLVPLVLLFLTVGVLMCLTGLGYGLWVVASQNKGPRQTVPHFRILARYAYDGPIMKTADWEIEAAERPRFYVKGMTPDGAVAEYETVIDVFYQAGEGMVGEAELQGRWLGKFIPYIGSA